MTSHRGKISNGRISAVGHKIHFIFGSTVTFSGSADNGPYVRLVTSHNLTCFLSNVYHIYDDDDDDGGGDV